MSLLYNRSHIFYALDLLKIIYKLFIRSFGFLIIIIFVFFYMSYTLALDELLYVCEAESKH